MCWILWERKKAINGEDHVLIELIRLTPTSIGKCIYASPPTLCIINLLSNRRGIEGRHFASDERGELKMHNLGSILRCISNPNFLPVARRGSREAPPVTSSSSSPIVRPPASLRFGVVRPPLPLDALLPAWRPSPQCPPGEERDVRALEWEGRRTPSRVGPSKIRSSATARDSGIWRGGAEPSADGEQGRDDVASPVAPARLMARARHMKERARWCGVDRTEQTNRGDATGGGA
jgi:hypothetical protein